MTPADRLNILIDMAVPIVGSQRQVAQKLGIEVSNLIKAKTGKRSVSWRTLAGLRVITGDDPAKAFTEELQRELEESPRELEQAAAREIKKSSEQKEEDTKMEINYRLYYLIEEAAKITGSYAALADRLQVPKSHITQMKKGERPANWKVLASLRVIAGEDAAKAFAEEAVKDLEGSPREIEREAAKELEQNLRAILDSLPNHIQKQKPSKPGFDRARCR